MAVCTILTNRKLCSKCLSKQSKVLLLVPTDKVGGRSALTSREIRNLNSLTLKISKSYGGGLRGPSENSDHRGASATLRHAAPRCVTSLPWLIRIMKPKRVGSWRQVDLTLPGNAALQCSDAMWLLAWKRPNVHPLMLS